MKCKMRRLRAWLWRGFKGYGWSWEDVSLTGHKYHIILKVDNHQIEQCQDCRFVCHIVGLDGKE